MDQGGGFIKDFLFLGWGRVTGRWSDGGCVYLVGYRFGDQLKELERRARSREGELPVEAWRVVTPLRWQAVESGLQDHPDRWWVEYLVKGIREGFRLGFSMGGKGLRASGRNTVSAGEQPQVVMDYLADEVKAKIMWLVGSQEEVRGVHCSPYGVIPKKGMPGKWRLILNLSALDGASVNDGIPKECRHCNMCLWTSWWWKCSTEGWVRS